MYSFFLFWEGGLQIWVGRGRGLLLHLSCPVCSVSGLYLPAVATFVSELLCCIYLFICWKNAEVVHDGRNIIQLQQKGSACSGPVFFSLLFPLHCCGTGSSSCFHLQAVPQVQPRILFIQDRKQLCTHFQAFIDKSMKTSWHCTHCSCCAQGMNDTLQFITSHDALLSCESDA